jgi:hypothetical protein
MTSTLADSLPLCRVMLALAMMLALCAAVRPLLNESNAQTQTTQHAEYSNDFVNLKPVML